MSNLTGTITDAMFENYSTIDIYSFYELPAFYELLKLFGTFKKCTCFLNTLKSPLSKYIEYLDDGMFLQIQYDKLKLTSNEIDTLLINYKVTPSVLELMSKSFQTTATFDDYKEALKYSYESFVHFDLYDLTKYITLDVTTLHLRTLLTLLSDSVEIGGSSLDQIRERFNFISENLDETKFSSIASTALSYKSFKKTKKNFVIWHNFFNVPGLSTVLTPVYVSDTGIEFYLNIELELKNYGDTQAGDLEFITPEYINTINDRLTKLSVDVANYDLCVQSKTACIVNKNLNDYISSKIDSILSNIDNTTCLDYYKIRRTLLNLKRCDSVVTLGDKSAITKLNSINTTINKVLAENGVI